MPADEVLSPAEVAELRALVEDLGFPDTYEVLRPTRTDTEEGGWTIGETVVSTGICRLRPVGESAEERIIVEQMISETAYSLDFAYAVDLTRADRVRVNATRTFEVVDVVRGGNWGFWATAVCKEIAR